MSFALTTPVAGGGGGRGGKKSNTSSTKAVSFREELESFQFDPSRKEQQPSEDQEQEDCKMEAAASSSTALASSSPKWLESASGDGEQVYMESEKAYNEILRHMDAWSQWNSLSSQDDYHHDEEEERRPLASWGATTPGRRLRTPGRKESLLDSAVGGTAATPMSLDEGSLESPLRRKTVTREEEYDSYEESDVNDYAERNDEGEYHDYSVADYEPYHVEFSRFWNMQQGVPQKHALILEQAQLMTDKDDNGQKKEKEEAQVANEKKAAALEFAQALSRACRHRASEFASSPSFRQEEEVAMMECQVWALLLTLRRLGPLSLLLPPPLPEESRRESSSAAAAAAMVQAVVPDSTTPMDIVDIYPADVHKRLLTVDPATVKSSSTSMAIAMLQRRHGILHWLEQCHSDRMATMEPPRPSTTGGRGDVMLATWNHTAQAVAAVSSRPSVPPPPPPQAVVDAAPLLEWCLCLLKSGRLEQSGAICAEWGQFYRAATWSQGDQPYGIVVDTDRGEQTSVGNEARSLYKTVCWTVSQKLAAVEAKLAVQAAALTSTTYESAIYALLSDNVDAALANRALTSWLDVLLIYMRAKVGHSLDQVLAAWNQRRRAAARQLGGLVVFPASRYPQEEQTHLKNTAKMALLQEADMIPDPPTDTPAAFWRSAMASFLVGVEHVSDFVLRYAQDLNATLESDTGESELKLDESTLRFITHVVLYLEWTCPGFVATQNDNDDDDDGEISRSVRDFLLLQYVQQLASRRRLWPLVTLYASLLPFEWIASLYPNFLTRILDTPTRQLVVQQAKECLGPDDATTLLQRAVQQMLLAPSDDENDEKIPSQSQLRKMRAIEWLCFHDEDRLDALLCANQLLRQLLLAQPTTHAAAPVPAPALESAKIFLRLYLPQVQHDVIPSFWKAQQEEEEEQPHDPADWETFYQADAELAAIRSFLEAHTALDLWKEECDNLTRCPPPSNVQGATTTTLVQFAETAADKLLYVLEFPTGWLSPTPTPTSTSSTTLRTKQMQNLRFTYLPQVVHWLHRVFLETAAQVSNDCVLAQDLRRRALSVAAVVAHPLHDILSASLDASEYGPLLAQSAVELIAGDQEEEIHDAEELEPLL